MGGVLAWVTWVAYLCGWRASVGGMLTWLRGWHASVGDVPVWVMWVVCVYVFTCALFRFGVIIQITN